MEVLALRAGFYQQARVREGQRFHLSSADDISCLWHEPLDKEAKEAFQAKLKQMEKDGIDLAMVQEGIVNVVSTSPLKHGDVAPGTLKRVNQTSTHATRSQAARAKKTTRDKLPKVPIPKAKTA